MQFITQESGELFLIDELNWTKPNWNLKRM